MNWGAFDLGVLLPAFAAGLLVLSTHLPLGRQVLARGIIFRDLAAAQMAGLGVIAAEALGFHGGDWQVQLAAGASALIGAAILHGLERCWPQIQEALIGVAFVLTVTASLLAVADHPHGGEQIKALLAGQILWVGWRQLAVVAVLYAGLLLVHALRPAGVVFYLVFAVAVTASVQLVGVYLVFATLILPALAVRGLDPPTALVRGYLIGALGYAVGLAVSAALDLPSGPAIVWALAVLALAGAGRRRLFGCDGWAGGRP